MLWFLCKAKGNEVLEPCAGAAAAAHAQESITAEQFWWQHRIPVRKSPDTVPVHQFEVIYVEAVGLRSEWFCLELFS